MPLPRLPLLVIFALALCAGFVASSCGATAGTCNPVTCSGCCNADGACLPGDASEACGAPGDACAVCDGASACVENSCVPMETACRGLDASCTSGGDCCTGNCVDNRCAAVASADGGTACSNVAGDRATQVCARWKCERADLSEGTWTGSLSGCVSGDNPVGRTHALRQLNLQRFLAQLPEVTDDPARNQKAQECALMMHANDQINHSPPTGWTCYTAGGAEAAKNSNLATTPGVAAIDLYMVDPGNASTLGHRRWMLSPGLGPVGLGSASTYSCLWVIGGTGTATRPYVAWPPPGPFPLQAFAPSSFGGSINSTGWSIQSETIVLTGALVTVTDNGTPVPVAVTQLAGGYGSKYAVRITPQGWEPQAGHSYQVSALGTTTPISYVVDVVDCP